MLNFFIKEESLASQCERSSYFFLFFSENCKTYLGIEEKICSTASVTSHIVLGTKKCLSPPASAILLKLRLKTIF